MAFSRLTATLDPSTTSAERVMDRLHLELTALEGILMDTPSPRRTSSNQQRVADFFRMHVRMFGYDWRALGWQSRGTQVRRFAVLAEIGPLAHTHVLDVGCGLADFY